MEEFPELGHLNVKRHLAESGRPQFSFRLLIATTDPIGHNAKRTLDELPRPFRTGSRRGQLAWLPVRPR
jgi:hypothetical protein